MMKSDMKILLIGAGAIAHEYVRAFFALGVKNIHVMSRTAASAEAFCKKWDLTATPGHGRDYIAAHAASYDGVVVASPVETLLPYLWDLTEAGARRILVEKPVPTGAKRKIDLWTG